MRNVMIITTMLLAATVCQAGESTPEVITAGSSIMRNFIIGAAVGAVIGAIQSLFKDEKK